VLAGGTSSRMGAPKPAVKLAGRPLIAYPIETIIAAGLEPVVVAKAESELPQVDCPIVRDTESALHPAAGILAALRAADGRPVVVIACDMPFVPPALVAWLAGLDAPVALPGARGRPQPLLARYGLSLAPTLEAAIERGESLHKAIGAVHPLIIDVEELTRFGEPDHITFNVNDREDLAAAERLMAVAPNR